MLNKKMKVSDLMIGDWVNFLIDVVGGEIEHYPAVNEYQPMRIESIYAFGEVDSEFDVINDASQLRAIPLTAEILAKNFKSEELPDDPYGAYFYESNEYVEVYIKEYTDGLWEVIVDEIEMGGLRSWKMYVSDVHQLQHALRLCGIDKEIEL